MISVGTIPILRHTCLTSLTGIIALTLLSPVSAKTPASSQPNSPNQVEPPTAPVNSNKVPPTVPSLPISPNQVQPLEPTDPNILRPLNQDKNILSLQGGQRLMTEASNAVSSQDYTLAAKKLQEARQVFNQLSNFYQELASSFSGIDNKIADSQRQKAVETAQMRDEATYQLALVHRAQNQPELSVPLLVQIIRSQNPTRDLGKKAYQQLFELGFVDSPYPRQGSGQPTSSLK